MKTKPIASAAALATSIAATPAFAAFGEDLSFLQAHTDVVVLSDSGGQAQVAVVPAWQGRVMTSTAGGAKGFSFGWVNRDLIASKKVEAHINVFGGEDRLWLGPEGGQFSIFFAKGVPFDLEHWFTPPSLDTEGFEVVTKAKDRVVCRRAVTLKNFSGTEFALEMGREVRLLKADDALGARGIKLPSGVSAVAFESVNSVKNTSKQAWKTESGLLSIWILGMLNATPAATIVAPFERGPETKLGPIVNDSYFGKVPTDRLVVGDNAIFFRADAKHRSKIGLSPRRAKPIIGSYDSSTGTLTLVWFTRPAGATDYVNSMWKLQDDPFSGDVSNAYNDGPAGADGKQLGQFYELESSSPALALAAGATATHVHQTLHLQGEPAALDTIARAALGVSLEQIAGAFKQ
jgi:hypothetical protein